MDSPLLRRLRAPRSLPGVRPAAVAVAVVASLGWSAGFACGSGSATGTSTSTGAGGTGGAPPIDYNGTTGDGDQTLNGDVTGESDTKDPDKPGCAPDSILDPSGACIPSCYESGAVCADADPTLCTGYPALQTYDCAACCTVPVADQTCPPGGCTDSDCPPGEDCSYTTTCPDGVCSADESCTTCPIDCGPCAAACGDGVCSAGYESCSDCPDDCGACAPGCGDGACDTGSPGGETCETCPEDCGNCLKVLTWDIDAGLKRGPSRVADTLAAIANAIALEQPDFVGLQSVDKLTARSGKVDQALFVAQRAQMYERFGAAFNYDGGEYGVAFLSKHPIVAMKKTMLATSGEWAKRRVLLTATLDTPAFYTDFHLGVTALAHVDAARLSQATTLAGIFGTEGDTLLVGDLFEAPSGPAVAEVQANGNFLDLWPTYGAGTGLTTATQRFDYVIAGLNWWNQAAAGMCATVVRTYVKPAKGLSSHRAVVAVLQQGLHGIDCGTHGTDDGGDDTGAIGAGYQQCVEDEDCSDDPVYRYCLDGFCSACRSDDDCTDPALPTCGAAHTCL